MTRDEIEFLAKHEMFTTFSQAFLNHDAKQRQVVEQQAQQIATLREALEGMVFIFGHNDGYAQVESAKHALKEHKP